MGGCSLKNLIHSRMENLKARQDRALLCSGSSTVSDQYQLSNCGQKTNNSSPPILYKRNLLLALHCIATVTSGDNDKMGTVPLYTSMSSLLTLQANACRFCMAACCWWCLYSFHDYCCQFSRNLVDPDEFWTLTSNFRQFQQHMRALPSRLWSQTLLPS